MFKIIIAVDEQDSELGHYFEQSKEYFHNYLSGVDNALPTKVVDTNNCHQTHIDLLIEQSNKPIIFVSYSHGLEHSLRCNNVAYLSADNIEPLLDSFVYAMSCSSAKKLGQHFDTKSGVYIGFKNEVKGFKSGDHLQKCIQCDNSGIMFALGNPDLPLKKAYKVMKNQYDQVIDRLDETGAVALHISYFRQMRDALSFIGNENLTINDLLRSTK